MSVDDDGTLVIQFVAVEHDGEYTCVAQNTAGSFLSAMCEQTIRILKKLKHFLKQVILKNYETHKKNQASQTNS